MKRLWITLALLIQPLCAAADNDCEKTDSCSYSSMWSGFSELRVSFKETKQKNGSAFGYIVTDDESLMTFETDTGVASILSIPRVATLWHGIGESGFRTQPECRKIVFDTVAIIQSYAVRTLFFLGFGVNGGPERVTDTMTIDRSSTVDTRVQINPGDHMTIPGPWSLQGTVTQTDRIDFDLLHEFTVKDRSVSLFLEGTWQDSAVTLPIDDEEPLTGWLVCLSATRTDTGGESPFESVIGDADRIKTIGDIRALIDAQDKHP